MKWILIINSHSKWQKRVRPSLAALYKMARVKSCEIQVTAKNWLWWSVYGKNIFLNKTIQMNFVLIPSEAGIRTQIDMNCYYQNFCHRLIITTISWPPPEFHNFFTLALLYSAARLGHTLFFYTTWMAFWVDYIYMSTAVCKYMYRTDQCTMCKYAGWHVTLYNY